MSGRSSIGRNQCCVRCFEQPAPSNPCVTCRACHERFHCSCIYPPLPHNIGSWECDACAEESFLVDGKDPHYSSCLGCGDFGSKTRLLSYCSACRAAYHSIGCASALQQINSSSTNSSSRRSSNSSTSYLPSTSNLACPSCYSALNSPPSVATDWAAFVSTQRDRPVLLLKGMKVLQDQSVALWKSSEIIHALNPRLLITRSGSRVLLQGQPSETSEPLGWNKIRGEISRFFTDGIPFPGWHVLVRWQGELALELDAPDEVQSLPNWFQKIGKSNSSGSPRRVPAAPSIAGSPLPLDPFTPWKEGKASQEEKEENPVSPSIVEPTKSITPRGSARVASKLASEKIASALKSPSSDGFASAQSDGKVETRDNKETNARNFPAKKSSAKRKLPMAEATPIKLAKKDGPRRAQQIRELLAQRNFQKPKPKTFLANLVPLQREVARDPEDSPVASPISPFRGTSFKIPPKWLHTGLTDSESDRRVDPFSSSDEGHRPTDRSAKFAAFVHGHRARNLRAKKNIKSIPLSGGRPIGSVLGLPDQRSEDGESPTSMRRRLEESERRKRIKVARANTVDYDEEEDEEDSVILEW